jgi:hypothetical protein
MSDGIEQMFEPAARTRLGLPDLTPEQMQAMAEALLTVLAERQRDATLSCRPV